MHFVMSSPQNPLKGVVLVLFAVVLFASIDTVGKHLMTKFNVPLVACIRYALNVVLLSVLVAPRYGKELWQAQRRSLVLVRALSLAFATLFASLALQRMPVGETVAILYLQGFGIMFASAYILKERINWVGWLGAIAGFAGVLLIARPGSALDGLGVLFALIAAAVSVVYILLSRSLAATENTMSLLFHVAVVGTVFFAVQLPFTWQSYSYSAIDIALLAFMGAASLAGHFLLTSAYRFAAASLLAPFNYFHIAMATLFGGIVYGHVPDRWALVGMATIGVAGAAIAIHVHVTRARA
jgi:drug/metabolite transporter (DMT)-like permease